MLDFFLRTLLNLRRNVVACRLERFDSNLEIIETVLSPVHEDDILGRQAVDAQEGLFDLRRKDVHAADDEHVVGAPENFAHAHGSAAASAGLVIQPHAIARAIA